MRGARGGPSLAAMTREKIKAALREAIKDADATRIATLRLVLTALRDRQHDRLEEEPDLAREERILRELLATMVRQRSAQARSYEEAGRLDLAAHEEAERQILEAFLPKPMADKDVERAIERAIWDSGASGQRDLARVMALLRTRHAGSMDFRRAGPRAMALLRARESW